MTGLVNPHENGPGPGDAELLLAQFLQPAPLQDVLAAMHERSLLHSSASAEGRSNLRFGWHELEALMARDAVNAADYRFFKNGKPIAPAVFGLVDGRGMLRSQALARVIAQGITIIGNRLEYKLPDFWPAMCALQRVTGGDVGLGFVASFECPKALSTHYDYVDNIIVQTEGTKHWRLFGDPIAGSGCQRTLQRTPEEPVRDLELCRGDLLFVPSGLHHLCSSEGNSLHLAMMINWPTGLQVLERVTRLAKEDEVVCEALRQFASQASIVASEQRIKQRLHELIDIVDVRTMLDELARLASREAHWKLPRREGTGLHSTEVNS